MERDRFPVVVHVLLFDAGRLALLRRARTGFMDGYYALPGGHQEHGESVVSAADRELREELGVTGAALTPVCVLPYRAGRHQGINFVLEARDWTSTPRINEPELFDALVWAAPDDLPEPFPDWIPTALELRRKGAWFVELEWD